MTANVRLLVLVSLAFAGAFGFASSAKARFACAETAVLATNEYVAGIANNAGCGPFPPGPRWDIQTVPATGTSTVDACPTPLPEPVGFVITQLQIATTACNGLTAKRIRRPTASTSTTTMACAVPNHVIPDGYVVASMGNHANCRQTSGASTGPFNAIRLPVPNPAPTGDTVCSTSPLPAGFVIHRYQTPVSACALSGTGPRKVIAVPSPTGTTTVCAGSPVPPNFAYFSVSPTTANCSTTGSGSGPGMQIGPPQDGSIVCSGTIPAEFSIVQVTTTATQCPNSIGLVVDHPEPGGSTECVLAGRPVPPGYVITEIDLNQTVCNGANLRHIRQPPTNGNTLDVCNGTPPVTDFVVTQISNDSVQCPSLGTPSRLRILKPSTTQSTPHVCSASLASWPLPSSLAITSFADVSGCGPTGTGSGPSVTLAPITSGATICASPSAGLGVVPENYVITQISSVSHCSANGSSRAFQVTALPTTQTACTVSGVVPAVPSGYVITDFFANVPSCGDPPPGTGIGYRLAVPNNTPGVETPVCAASPVPSGFVIVQTRNDLGQCTPIGNSNGKVITVPSQTSQTTVCVDASAPVPAGMVITAIVTTGNCTGNAHVIEYPSITGDTQVCTGTTIPQFYSQVGGNTTFPQCAPGTPSGPGFVIRPNNPAIVPTPGVTPEPDVTATPAAVTPACTGTPSSGFVKTGTPKNVATCP